MKQFPMKLVGLPDVPVEEFVKEVNPDELASIYEDARMLHDGYAKSLNSPSSDYDESEEVLRQKVDFWREVEKKLSYRLTESPQVLDESS